MNSRLARLLLGPMSRCGICRIVDPKRLCVSANTCKGQVDVGASHRGYARGRKFLELAV